MRSGNAVSSHSGLIPSETAHEKRGGLLRPIARRKNLISLRSASFFTNFVSNLVHAYKFPGNLKIAFFKKLDNPEINHQFTCTLRASRFQGHWKQGRQWGFKCHKIFSLRFCVFKWASSLFTGIFFKFHIHVHNFSKTTNLQSKWPFNYFPVILRSLRTNENKVNDNLYCRTET